MDRKQIIFLFVAILLFLLIILELATYYFLKKSTPSSPDAASLNRIQTLSQVLRSRFGTNWPVTLAVILLMIIGILICLYLLTLKEVNIEMGSKITIFTTVFGTIFFIVASGAILYYSYLTYSKNIKKQQEEMDPDNMELTQKRQQIVQLTVGVIGLILLILLILGGGLFVVKKLKTKIAQ